MRAELLQMAADLAHREEPFVLAVVVRRQPASSSQAGDMALITAAGAFHGFYRDHVVVDQANVARSKARLRLVRSVQVALRQTLGLLGVPAPDSM